MKTLAYTVNLQELFNVQDEQKIHNDVQKEAKTEEGIRNKTKLLKIALPYLHSIYALHNRKCTISGHVSTGKYGLLGLSKVDIEEKIDFIVNTDHHLIWSDNFRTLNIDSGICEIKIWLHSLGKHVHNPNMEYSMTSVTSKVYGESVEEELQYIAKHCAIYKDEW